MSDSRNLGDRPDSWKPGSKETSSTDPRTTREHTEISTGTALTPVTTQSQRPASSTAVPGWYIEPGHPGVLRYWSGSRWEEWRRPLVADPTVRSNTRDTKDTTAAILLCLFLGATGAHNFYLGRTGVAVTMLVLWIFGLLTSWLFIGIPILVGLLIWSIVDLCLIPSYIRASTP